MNRPSLAKMKGVWRDQCFKDQKLRPATFKLAYAIADFITMPASVEKYRQKGKIIVWPSQEALRRKTNLNLDTISGGVAQLIERGHLKRLRRGNQYRGSNKYRLVVQEAATPAPSI
jgi:hypothetical protein